MNLTICGDFVPIGRGVNTVKNRSALDNEIVDLLKEADVSIVNLEAPVSESTETCIYKNGPHLHTTSDAIKYLKECGVDVVTLANNHFYDHGHNGVKHTLDACKENDVRYVGGGLTNDEVSKILFIEKDEISLAILNYCEREFSVRVNEGSNHIDPISVYYDIQKAKKYSDYILVITHGGHEGYNLPSPRMKELYRYFIDLGANVVVNHHQHCYSGYEEYNGGLIFYGLGNFFFDDFRSVKHRSSLWNFGFMTTIEITNNGFKYKLLPYIQCAKNACTCLLDTAEHEKFEDSIIKLNAIINDDKQLNAYFDEWCNKQKFFVLSCFTPYSSRILLALCRKGLLPSFMSRRKKLQLLNMIRCEAHRDKTIFALTDNENHL